MYVDPNFPTKVALRRAVAEGADVFIFQPGIGTTPRAGKNISVEGPHYPKPHSWYALVDVLDGKVVKVR